MLWSDERIAHIAHIATEATTGGLSVGGAVAVAVGYMMVMRDEYEARLAELEAELQRCRKQEAARF